MDMVDLRKVLIHILCGNIAVIHISIPGHKPMNPELVYFWCSFSIEEGQIDAFCSSNISLTIAIQYDEVICIPLLAALLAVHDPITNTHMRL